jgi:hypothetical protein
MLESGPKIQWLPMPILETSSWLGGWVPRSPTTSRGFGHHSILQTPFSSVWWLPNPPKHVLKALNKSCILFLETQYLCRRKVKIQKQTNAPIPPQSVGRVILHYIFFLGTVLPRHRKLIAEKQWFNMFNWGFPHISIDIWGP